jgi:hypothetical protein
MAIRNNQWTPEVGDKVQARIKGRKRNATIDQFGKGRRVRIELDGGKGQRLFWVQVNELEPRLVGKDAEYKGLRCMVNIIDGSRTYIPEGWAPCNYMEALSS